VTKYRLAAFALILLQAGCNALRQVERPVGAPDPTIPSADVTVEVEELPGLFQVTERR